MSFTNVLSMEIVTASDQSKTVHGFVSGTVGRLFFRQELAIGEEADTDFCSPCTAVNFTSARSTSVLGEC